MINHTMARKVMKSYTWLIERKYLVTNSFFLIGVVLICALLLKRIRLENMGDLWFIYPAFVWTLITFILVSSALLMYGWLIDQMILDRKIRFLKPENWRRTINETLHYKKEIAFAAVRVLLFLGIQGLLTTILAFVLPFGFVEIMFFQLIITILIFFPRTSGLQKTEQAPLNAMNISSFIYFALFIYLVVQQYGG